MIPLRRRPTRFARLKRRSAKLHIFRQSRDKLSSIRCGVLIQLCIQCYQLLSFEEVYECQVELDYSTVGPIGP